jgi:4-amino-4-deoxy-L-arabinose transferase-like glycosyltransferase
VLILANKLPRWRPNQWLLAIVIGAVVLRLGFVLAFGQTLSLQASGYDTYAVNLLERQAFTRYPDRAGDSDLPPLYIFFLAGVYSTLGRSAQAVALAQIALDVITLMAVAHIGRRLSAGAGLLAAAFTAFYPYLLFQNLSTNDTAVFITLLALAVLGAYHIAEAKGLKMAVWVGFALGLAALTKSLVILLLPMLALWWWGRLGLRRAFLASALMGIVFGLTIGGWVIRNTGLHGQLTLISTNDGSNLHQGNNQCALEYLQNEWDVQWVTCLADTPTGLSELAEAAWHRQQALAYLQENASTVPALFFGKFVTLWHPKLLPTTIPPTARLDDKAVLQYETPVFRAARVVHLLYFGPLLILGSLGIVLAWRKVGLAQIAPLLAVLLAISITYVIYHPSTRYRAPADPFFFIFAGYALVRLSQWWRARNAI